MKISLTAFTDRGEALAVRITKQLNNDGEQAKFVRCGKRHMSADSEPACPDDGGLRPLEPDTYVRAADWTAKKTYDVYLPQGFLSVLPVLPCGRSRRI